MKITCPECKGTGLRMPLCDAECPECEGSGNKEKIFEKKEKVKYPDTEDGELVGRLMDEEDLNDWEIKFCNSVGIQVMAGKSLTDKQRNKIREILEEHND
jgi:RecJ-like exonuclease